MSVVSRRVDSPLVHIDRQTLRLLLCNSVLGISEPIVIPERQLQSTPVCTTERTVRQTISNQYNAQCFHSTSLSQSAVMHSEAHTGLCWSLLGSVRPSAQVCLAQSRSEPLSPSLAVGFPTEHRSLSKWIPTIVEQLLYNSYLRCSHGNRNFSFFLSPSPRY